MNKYENIIECNGDISGDFIVISSIIDSSGAENDVNSSDIDIITVIDSSSIITISDSDRSNDDSVIVVNDSSVINISDSASNIENDNAMIISVSSASVINISDSSSIDCYENSPSFDILSSSKLLLPQPRTSTPSVQQIAFDTAHNLKNCKFFFSSFFFD